MTKPAAMSIGVPPWTVLSQLLSADDQSTAHSDQSIEESDRSEYEILVPRAGVEPARGCPQRFSRPPNECSLTFADVRWNTKILLGSVQVYAVVRPSSP
jgi:hypothetical protein